MRKDPTNALRRNAVAILALTAFAVVSLVAFAHAENGIAGDDGLTDQARAELFGQKNLSSSQDYCERSVLIVDTLNPVVYWGMYRLSQMTEPGWDLWARTIGWLIDDQDPATLRVFLAGVDSDGDAAYNRLVNQMGFHPDSVSQVDPFGYADSAFIHYDLFLYVHTSASPIANLMAMGMPILTVSNTHSAVLGIGSGSMEMHEDRDWVVVANNDHYITEDYDLGVTFFADSMWMDAVYATGSGVALLHADVDCYYEPAEVAVDLVEGTVWGEPVSADIRLTRSPAWFDVGGFDLHLAYQEAYLSNMTVTPGVLPEGCQWSYFNWRVGDFPECDFPPCQYSSIRIVGLIDHDGAPPDADCNPDEGTVLATLSFTPSDDVALECNYASIRFVWNDCGDNDFVSPDGSELYGSNEVRFNQFDMNQAADSAFPTFHGANSSCDSVPRFSRRFDYIGGGYSFPCDYHIDETGDINLNGLAYEIADWVLFAGYFFYGLDEFTIDVADQTAATDVNYDGVPLTINDQVYLERVIFGDALPLTGPVPMTVSTDTAVFFQDTLNKIIGYSYPDTLAAVFLLFEGDIMPDNWTDSSRPFDGTHTRYLLEGAQFMGNDSLHIQDSIMFYVGEGRLIYAQVGTDGLTLIPARIEGVDLCCKTRGNVDHSEDQEISISDLVYLVNYYFLNGAPPACFDEADLDADFELSITDIVRMVDFMFLSGPPPIPCLR